MKVGQATNSPKFLKGTHAIEYVSTYAGQQNPEDAYNIRQVTVAKDKDGPLCIERHRGFNSKVTDPYPRWVVIRGSGITRETKESAAGFYGLWLPHLGDLTAECKLVPLKKGDRAIDGRIADNKKWWER